MGSPPRVRGTVHAHTPMGLWIGITPACAGNRQTGILTCLPMKDHPRVCGEQLYYKFNRHKRGGSPPRVRGTEGLRLDFGIWTRITPACAGNSPILTPKMCQNRDHPRVCGEQNSHSTATQDRLGSPPRVRGTAPHPVVVDDHHRITPACAGNSLPCSPMAGFF